MIERHTETRIRPRDYAIAAGLLALMPIAAVIDLIDAVHRTIDEWVWGRR